MPEKKRSFGNASLAMILGQVANIGVSFLSIVILSRMLPAEDFGLIAMVVVFTSAGLLLTDLGLATSALRSPHLTQSQASNLFWMNALLGTIALLTLIALSPLIARIYGEPRLYLISIVLAFGLLASGLQAQFQVQLAHAGKFGPLAVVGAASSTLGLLVAVAGANLGWSYWALVAQSLTISYSSLIIKVVASRWRPSAPRRGSGTKALTVSGSHFFGAGALHQVTANVDSFAIGLGWGPASVGVFGRAKQLADLPITLLTPLRNVVVPTVTADRAQNRDIQGRLIRVQGSIGTVGIGLLAVIAAAAPDLIPLALGNDWDEVVPLFRILAMGTAVRTLTQVSFWAFTALGSSRDWLRYNIISKLLTVLLITIGAFISLPAVAIGQAIGSTLGWVLNVAWLGRTTELKPGPFYKNGTRLLITGLIATCVGALAPQTSSVFATVILQATLTGCVFLVLIALSRAGRRDLRDLSSVFKGLRA